MASSSGAACQVGAMKRPASGSYDEAKRRNMSPPTYATLTPSSQPSALAALLAAPRRQPPAAPSALRSLLTAPPPSFSATSPVLRSILATPTPSSSATLHSLLGAPQHQLPAAVNPVPSALRSLLAPPPRQLPSPFSALRLPTGARPTPKQRKLFLSFCHCFIFTVPESCILLQDKLLLIVYFISLNFMLLIAALKTKTALGGATTKTTLPTTDADQDIHNYFAAQEDAIRGVIDQAVLKDV